MAFPLRSVARQTLDSIRKQGLLKVERVISSAQGADITVDGKPYLNFCANNYLGLADDQELLAAVRDGLTAYGYGMASVRFICGTQTQHTELEADLAKLLGMDDAVLYSSCFDANTGLFETILGPDDAIISDALNHASIIDGIRLCKAERSVYAHSDMADLEEKLKAAQRKRLILIATDGVFSMDGEVAKLDAICDLAERYGASVMADDSHGTGVIGATGRGSLEATGTLGRVDIVTSTLGKALGGAAGGFTAASKDVTDLLRQRSRPYLFSNTLAPVIVAGARYVLAHFDDFAERRSQLARNAQSFRQTMRERGFTVPDGDHPIVPIMLGDEALTRKMAEAVLAQGIYAIGFWYPVVPKGKARIRVQLSTVHTPDHIERAVAAFTKAGMELGIVKRSRT
ncbi:MAG: glycine C-acetyltransferase [Candidatus Kerfeldbacteria bacterium]|nr:glycine C-acetyltransferase [Candidatus Kerfeldbacteria bacterium]